MVLLMMQKDGLLVTISHSEHLKIIYKINKQIMCRDLNNFVITLYYTHKYKVSLQQLHLKLIFL